MNNDYIDNIDKLDLDNELNVKVNSFSWGKSSNLLVFCTDLKSNVEFSFSVWNNNGYSSRSGEFNFKQLKDNYKDEDSFLTLKLVKTKSGYLDCKNARVSNGN